jgi:hypothetical protein
MALRRHRLRLCRRCLNCARHRPCPDPQLVGEDEADEPEVVGLKKGDF